MGGTAFASESQPAGEPIDGDDRIAACDARRHQTGQADPADTVHRDRLSGGGLHHIQHRTGAGLQTAAKWTQQFDWRVTADLDDVLGRGDSETRKRGLLKEAGINGLAVAAHWGRAVRAAAARFELAGALAIGDALGAAGSTFAAPWGT